MTPNQTECTDPTDCGCDPEGPPDTQDFPLAIATDPAWAHRDLLDMVREFHDAADVQTPSSPVLPDVTPANRRHIKSELQFAASQLRIAHRSLQGAAPDLTSTAPVQRVALMIEELRELIEAIAEGDLPHILKEAEDLLYVTFGTLLRFGLHGCHDEAAIAVHESNIAKCVAGPNGPRLTVDSRGKVQKPEGWVPPDLSAIVAKAARPA